jgi:hypothetical protein
MGPRSPSVIGAGRSHAGEPSASSSHGRTRSALAAFIGPPHQTLADQAAGDPLRGQAVSRLVEVTPSSIVLPLVRAGPRAMRRRRPELVEHRDQTNAVALGDRPQASLRIVRIELAAQQPQGPG